MKTPEAPAANVGTTCGRNSRTWARRAAQVLQGTPTRWTLRSLLGLRPRPTPQTVQAGPRIVAPPLLHPVGRGDADRWLKQQFDVMSTGHASAKAMTDRLFGTRTAAKHGVALADFADALKPVFAPEGVRRAGPGAVGG